MPNIDRQSCSEIYRQKAAVFLDRDGVINEERDYVFRCEDFSFLPGAIDGLTLLQDAGFQLVVITNQSGIARGFYSEDDYLKLTRYMCDQLSKSNIVLAGVYHSPYHPLYGLEKYRIDSDCRKPKPGMIFRARDELGIDLNRSILIGDKRSDIDAGRSAGVKSCLLVRSGHPVADVDLASADACFDDLRGAAQWVVNNRMTLID